MLDEEPEKREGAVSQDLDAAGLTLGKPFLVPLSAATTVAEALSALDYNQDVDVLSVWVGGNGSSEIGIDASEQEQDWVGAEKSAHRDKRQYHCKGIISTLDIVVFLAKDLGNFGTALSTPLSVLLPKISRDVEHVHPHTSLYDAYELMLDGVQHLVVPTCNPLRRWTPSKIPQSLFSKDLPAGEYCWITQEDVVRHLLASLGAFFPLPMMTLKELGMINEDVMVVDADSPAIQAVPLLERASQLMTAVGVVQADSTTETGHQKHRPKLVGDIWTQTMRRCSVTAAAAIATLSVREFLEFAHEPDSPPEHLLRKIARGLQRKGLKPKVLDHLECLHAPDHVQLSPVLSALSCDDDTMADWSLSDGDPLPKEKLDSMNRHSSIVHPVDNHDVLIVHPVDNHDVCKALKMVQHTQPTAIITCRPNSTLVAVMAQTLALRANHTWVTDLDGGLVGIVTYADIINVLLSQLRCAD